MTLHENALDRAPERMEKAEMRQFCHELVASVSRLMQLYEEAGEQSPMTRLRELRGDSRADVAERVCNLQPEYLSWFVLNQLASEGHSELATELWKQTLSHAKDHILAGESAYDAIRLPQDSPLEKARFKVLVQDFSHAWRPIGGIEWSLIHQLAQAQILYERWLRKHVDRMTLQGVEDEGLVSKSRSMGRGSWAAPRVTDAEAIEQAQQMADRFQKAHLRIIRALRDLRRHAPLVIRNAEQVNVAEKQVNVKVK